MAEPSPDWKKVALEYQRQAAEATRQVAEATRGREAAEALLRPTTLPEYLAGCHNYLYQSLNVGKKSLSTKGDPANAYRKLRPEKLCEWKYFLNYQAEILENLMDSDFVSLRLFASMSSIEQKGQDFEHESISSELDVHSFQRYTVEGPVTQIIKKMYENEETKQQFGLRGFINFENHANTLDPDPILDQRLEQLSVGDMQQPQRALHFQPRDTERNLLAATDTVTSPVARSSKTDVAGEDGAGTTSASPADQFCVYNTSDGHKINRVPVFIAEFKAPHKVTLGHIIQDLKDMTVQDVIPVRQGKGHAQYRYRQLMAAVITQAFSYMVKMGMEYGCVCTAEAVVFLRVPEEDFKTVYYYLSIPKFDVGETAEWDPNPNKPNRLHMTAVGQMLAFTLQALKKPPRSHTWRDHAVDNLNRWEVGVHELLKEMVKDGEPSADYRPPRDDGYSRSSPIRLRPRPARSCNPTGLKPLDEHDSSDEEPDTNTPSRPATSLQNRLRTQPLAGKSSSSQASRQSTQGRQYCTQKCLLGLVTGGPLDASCPNVRDHGESRHRIRVQTFLNFLRQQLAKDRDTDCEPVSRPGSTSVLFQVRLASHGYTVAAKTVPVHFIFRLQREAAIYERLRPIQGIHVPVYLGNIDLEKPYRYWGNCNMVHMMLLSFGGTFIRDHMTADNSPQVVELADQSVQAIHDLGVLHHDLESRNILWNEETSRPMVIDFERSEVLKTTSELSVISPDRKRKRENEDGEDEEDEEDEDYLYRVERNCMRRDLTSPLTWRHFEAH